MNNTTNTGGPAFPHDPDAQLNTLPAQIRAGEDAVIANLQSMGLARAERDRPAALAASEASQAKAKRETALLEAMQALLAEADKGIPVSPLARIAARVAIAHFNGAPQ